MSDSIRAALERLVEALKDYEPIWGGFPESALAAARAALAEQQGEGEVPINWPAYFLRVADNQAREIEQMLRQAPPGMVEPLPAAPPAPLEGEVAELVELLHKEAADDEIGDHMLWMTPADARRAAELLQQQHPTPVPVSERPWEREGWCDKQGRCWCVQPLDGLPHSWWLVRPEPLSHGFVLPAHALPLPQGEVEK